MQATLSRLGTADRRSLRRLLDSAPVHNAYLRSELRAGLAGMWLGVHHDTELRAAALGGSLVVPCIPDRGYAALLAEGLQRESPPQMLVGPREGVQALHLALHHRPARDLRDPQPLLVIGRELVPPRGIRPGVRRATRADLPMLASAAAAMHREEMGGDHIAIDQRAWEARMATLIERGWSYVWTDGDELIFKAELSAWTPEAVQIQGVYTAPSHRGRGVAAAGLARACSILLRRVPLCSLYVNQYNAPARRLYDRLGFRHLADFATVIY